MRVFVVALLCSLSALCAAVSPQEKAAKAMTTMQGFMMNSTDAVITMNDKQYKNFVLLKYREYKLVVLYTALEAKFKCAVCSDVDTEFANVAMTYRKSLYNPASTNQLFFVRVDYKDGQKTFAKHGFQQVPAIVYHGPWDVRVPNKYESSFEVADKMPIDGSPSAEDMSKFVARKSGFNIEILRSALPKMMFLLFIVSIVIIVGKALIVNLESLLVIRKYTNLWRYGCIAVYGMSISGVVYDIIRTPLPFYCRESGCIFFHPQSGQQFVVEGLVIGFLNLACAACVIWIYKFAPYQPLKSSRAGGVMIGAIAFFFLYSQIVSLYRFKSAWYPYKLLF